MFLRCDVCGYDSGDFDSNEEIAEKVKADGGEMMQVYDGEKSNGWIATCPNGHGLDHARID